MLFLLFQQNLQIQTPQPGAVGGGDFESEIPSLLPKDSEIIQTAPGRITASKSRQNEGLIADPKTFIIDWRLFTNVVSDTTYISSDSSSDSGSISSCGTCSPMPAILKQNVKIEVGKNYSLSASMLDTECFPSSLSDDDQSESLTPQRPTAQSEGANVEKVSAQSESTKDLLDQCESNPQHNPTRLECASPNSTSAPKPTDSTANSSETPNSTPVGQTNSSDNSKSAVASNLMAQSKSTHATNIAESEKVCRTRPVNVQSQTAQIQTAFSDDEKESNNNITVKCNGQETSREAGDQRPAENIMLTEPGKGEVTDTSSEQSEPKTKSASARVSISLSRPPSQASVCASAISYGNPLVPVTSSREESPFVLPLVDSEAPTIEDSVEKEGINVALDLIVKKEPEARAIIPTNLVDEVICLDSSSSSSPSSSPKGSKSCAKSPTPNQPVGLSSSEQPNNSTDPNENDNEAADSIEAPESWPSQMEILVGPNSIKANDVTHSHDAAKPPQDPLVAAEPSKESVAEHVPSQEPHEPRQEPHEPPQEPRERPHGSGSIHNTETCPPMTLPSATSISSPIPAPNPLPLGVNANSALTRPCVKTEPTPILARSSSPQLPMFFDLTRDDASSDSVDSSGIKITRSGPTHETTQKVNDWLLKMPENPLVPEDDPPQQTAVKPTATVTPMHCQNTQSLTNPTTSAPNTRPLHGANNVPVSETANHSRNQLSATDKNPAISQPHTQCQPFAVTPARPTQYPSNVPQVRVSTSHVPTQVRAQSQGMGDPVKSNQHMYQQQASNNASHSGWTGQPTHAPRGQFPVVPGMNNQYYSHGLYPTRYNSNLPYPHPNNVLPGFDFGANPAWQPSHPMQFNQGQFHTMMNNQMRATPLPNNGMPRMAPAGPPYRSPSPNSAYFQSSQISNVISNVQHSQPPGANPQHYAPQNMQPQVHHFGQLPSFGPSYNQPGRGGATPSPELQRATHSPYGQPPHAPSCPPTLGQQTQQGNAHSSLPGAIGQPPQQQSVVPPVIRDKQLSPVPQDSKSQMQKYIHSNLVHDTGAQGASNLAGHSDTSLPPRKRKVYKDIIVLDDS